MKAAGATNLKVRCSRVAGRVWTEVDIEGSGEALAVLGNCLAEDASELSTLAEFDPSPYDAVLTTIRVRARPAGRVTFAVESDSRTLRISGAREFLDVLADNVLGFAREAHARGDHIHIEFFPDHYYLDDCPIALVISCCGQP
jgi:hypothetical protein